MSLLLTGLKGRLYYYGSATITLDSSGTGTTNISFPSGFNSVPAVFAVPRLADAGIYTSESETISGCTLRITNSDIRSSTVDVIFIVHEKL